MEAGTLLVNAEPIPFCEVTNLCCTTWLLFSELIARKRQNVQRLFSLAQLLEFLVAFISVASFARNIGDQHSRSALQRFKGKISAINVLGGQGKEI